MLTRPAMWTRPLTAAEVAALSVSPWTVFEKPNSLRRLARWLQRRIGNAFYRVAWRVLPAQWCERIFNESV